MEGEKRNLQQPPTDARSTLASNGKLPWVVWLVGGAVATCLLANSIAPSSLLPKTPLQQEPVAFSPNDACPQPALLTPSTQYYGELDAIWKTPSFKAQAIEWLSGAVKVETESYDDMSPVGQDERWEKFQAFHDYLERAFPRVYQTLKLTKVNAYGLLYEWVGTNAELKPLLFMAHQDVVPVEKDTYADWVHPPYSGHYDGTYIWGRGCIDDKSSLIGIMAAVESMLQTGFTPKRTIVLSFGFDEEVSGPQGAAHLAKHLEAIYGPDSFALILDEGGGYMNVFGANIAAFGTAEKGYADIRVSVSAAAGHSSVPPDHTSIGYLSHLIVHLESNPHPLHLTRKNPFYSALVCAASYGSLPRPMDALVKGSLTDDNALYQLEGWLRTQKQFKPLIGTSQAVDLTGGGHKVNALPETAWAVINHRIGIDSSTAELKERTVRLISEKARELNLTLTAFGQDVLSSPGVAHVDVEAFGHWLEPLPITIASPETKAWNVLAGTIKSTFATRLHDDDVTVGSTEIVTTPCMLSFNSDTKYYVRLSKQVYRYRQISPGDFYVASGIHSVNEAFKATSFVNSIRAFGTLILNADENDM